MIIARRLGFIALVLFASVAFAQPRSPLPQSYVSDEYGLLADDTKRELDRLAATLDDKRLGEIGFLIVRTTGGVDPRSYGTQAFNAWGVGDRQLNNGTLFLLALDDRATEIILGSGIDNASYTRMAEDVMRNEILPRFRQGSFDQGLVAGATAWLAKAYRVDLGRLAEMPTEAQGVASSAVRDTVARLASPPPPARPASSPTATTKPDPDDRTALLVGLTLIGTLAAGALWLLWKVFSALWWLVGSRFFPRKCARCSTPMILLSETEDDRHLTPQQITEERVRSVDHRVFHCPGCGHVDKLVRAAWFSRFQPCASCGSKAVSSVSRTITSATRFSTGLAEITSTCQHCHATSTARHVIARVTSSSSSSGRSFGGGSSRGGGASGRF